MKWINGLTYMNQYLKDAPYTSTRDMLNRINTFAPKKLVLGEKKADGHIARHTANEVYRDVNNIGEGLLALGLKDKHIAIIADNSYNYIVTELAIIGGVGVAVPIDKDANEELLLTLINKADVDAIICSSFVLRKIAQIKDRFNRETKIFTMNENTACLRTLNDIRKIGMKANKSRYSSLELDLDKTCKILFTSGTTGMNKAVQLSQRNLATNIMNFYSVVKFANDSNDTSLSVLPMHHATEVNTHIYPRLGAAKLTYINGDMRDLIKNVKIFKPHTMTIVPMIANSFYKNIWVTAKKKGYETQLKNKIRLYNIFKSAKMDFSRSYFKKVYEMFGGNIRQIICGGAMLNNKVVKGFSDLGIEVLNGYGITECGPLISANSNTRKDSRSVGVPCKWLEAKIDQEDETGIGELCIKGDNVSKGYYKDEEATQKVFDKDGFFHTGDYAFIRNDGNIVLSGRKKYIIVLDNGKNICPEDIENTVENELSYVNEVVIYGYQEEHEGEYDSTLLCAGLYIEDPNIRCDPKKIINDIREINKKIPTYKKISLINLSNHEYDKTSSKKIIRDSVMKYHEKERSFKV